MPSREAYGLRGDLHSSIRVVRQSGGDVDKIRRNKEVKYFNTLMPTSNGLTMYTCFHNSVHNVLKAANERVLHMWDGSKLVRPQQPAADNIVHAQMKFAFDKFKDYAKRASKVLPITGEEFVACYSGRKRKVYQQALESLKHTCIQAKDAWVKWFVKFEKLEYLLKGLSKVVPRLISPRDPRFNLELGRFLHPLEKIIFTMIDDVCRTIQGVVGDTEKTVLKGCNAIEKATHMRSKFDRISECVMVGMDASRFDAHVSKVMLEWEHSVYLFFFGRHHRSKLARLLRMQIKNTCRAFVDGFKIICKLIGVRMSGDMNTSLGNTLLMCGMIISFMNYLGITNYAFVNDGDDSVLFISIKDLRRLIREVGPWFSRLGFTMELEPPVYCFEEVEFCQCKPLWNGSQWIMVRKIETLTKDSNLLKYTNNEYSFKALAYAVGECGLSITQGIPVSQAFYQSLCNYGQETIGSKRLERMREEVAEGQWGMAGLAEGLTVGSKYRKPAFSARTSYFIQNHISPDAQIEIEQHYLSINWSKTTIENNAIFQAFLAAA